MTRIAVYPGSFDPPTCGHTDLVQRGLALADHLVVAVARHSTKEPLFTVQERLDMLRAAVGDEKRVSYESFEGLLVDFARSKRATLILRGLRAVSDFEYEFQMAMMNRHLHPGLETVFLVPPEDATYVSSSLVREVAKHGGDVTGLVHPVVAAALKKRYGK
ncbi:MAG TPA: pantetheine-phosphate adenylyltransferase [Gemmatimonadales bacterium]|nr:pantetheine-phosphate adenylyltransferase [Gemmatimonadales bacterium]